MYLLKCFCHSFHLVAGHACETLSNTAEQLTHDIYNHFKNSPNRKKSYEEFQQFFDCEPHKILKPTQTQWLSLSHCVKRIISQWPALDALFTAEVFETKSLQAEKILLHLRSHYIKATFEFVDFVLADLTGMNALFQSNEFKLRRLLPERVVRMFCTSFLRTINDDLTKVDMDKIDNWLPLNSIYPGILSHETVKAIVPHEKERFLSRLQRL